MSDAADRKGRATEIIAREAAQFITREAGSGSLITVIRAQSASHGDRVLVFISVFPKRRRRRRSPFSNGIAKRSQTI